MRLARFFASGGDLARLKQLIASSFEPGMRIELAEDDLIKQLRSVLRLGQGHRFILLDGDGGTFELEIERMEKNRVHCLFSKAVASVSSGHNKVNVALALIKQDRFEWCLEKLTEIGVNEITPVQCRHCVARLSVAGQGDERVAGKLVRWQAIVKEAAEQSERGTIPPVVKPQSLDDYLQRSTSGGTDQWRFICAERYDAAPLVKALPEKISSSDPFGGDRDKNYMLADRTRRRLRCGRNCRSNCSGLVAGNARFAHLAQ